MRWKLRDERGKKMMQQKKERGKRRDWGQEGRGGRIREGGRKIAGQDWRWERREEDKRWKDEGTKRDKRKKERLQSKGCWKQQETRSRESGRCLITVPPFPLLTLPPLHSSLHLHSHKHPVFLFRMVLVLMGVLRHPAATSDALTCSDNRPWKGCHCQNTLKVTFADEHSTHVQMVLFPKLIHILTNIQTVERVGVKMLCVKLNAGYSVL